MNICKEEYEAFSKLTDGRQKQFYVWMLANGKEFQGRALTCVEERKLQTKVSRKLYTLGTCMLQSQTGVIDGEFIYFEGLATSAQLGIPLEHAWLADAEGKVWDATWKDGRDYFGVQIPRDFIVKNMFETGEAQGLLAKYYAKEVLKENGKTKN